MSRPLTQPSPTLSTMEKPLQRAPSRAWLRRALCMLLAVTVLALVIFLSLSVGAKPIPLHTVTAALQGQCALSDCVIVRDARLPRTLAGLLAGVALGLSGALMQILTRNPLADPGILGVNAGAGFAVVLGITFFGAAEVSQYLWFACAGGDADGGVDRCDGRRQGQSGPPDAGRCGTRCGAGGVFFRYFTAKPAGAGSTAFLAGRYAGYPQYGGDPRGDAADRRRCCSHAADDPCPEHSQHGK